MPETQLGQRLDIWLFRTRLLKSRALATAFITKGKVRITRHTKTHRVKKPGFRIAADDQVVFMSGTLLIQAKVVGLPTRRGPAPEAREFYTLIPTQICDSDSS